MIDRTIPPPHNPVAEIDVVKAQKHVLSNGVPIYYVNAGSQEVLKLELIVRAGSCYENVKGTSFFTSQMLTEGTANYTAAQIAEILAFYGAQIEVSPGFDFSSISIYLLRKNLSEILPIVREMITTAQFDEQELVTQKALKFDSLKVNLEKNQFVASRKIREVLFGSSHPYGRSIELEDIEPITTDLVNSFYSDRFNQTPTLVLSGMVMQEDLDIVEAQFDDLSFALDSVPSTNKDAKPQKELIIEKPGSLQASIRIGKAAPAKNHPDYIKTLIVNEILGGYFGSRLMKNIREEKGFTYGIYSSIMNLHLGALQVIGTDVKKEFAQQTLDEIFKETDLLSTKQIGAEELQTVKSYMQGSFLSSINTPFSLADKFKSVHFHDLDYDFYDRYLNTILSITPEEIMETAKTHFRSEDYSTVVVG